MLGPNPVHEGSILPLSTHDPLLVPGIDNEGDAGPQNDDEVEGAEGEDGNGRMAADADSDGDSSPIPTTARCLQKPWIQFVFDDITSDLDPYPTIFLPRCSVPQEQNLRRSARPHASPANPNSAYLNAAQGSKSDSKTKKKDSKRNDKTPGDTIPLKHAWNDDGTMEVKDRLASKRPKLKETIVIPKDECEFFLIFVRSFLNLFLAAVATKVVCKHGPGPSKLLPVTLGVSGGGFGEKVPPSAKVVRNGVKSIGILVVDKDFGAFMEVDKSYWSKAIVPFVGERVGVLFVFFCQFI